MKLVTSGLIFCVLLFSVVACVNKKKNPDAQITDLDTSILSTIDSNIVVPLEYYKRFEGSIAGQPVILQMSSLSNKISGIYYYENIGNPVYFSAQLAAGDSLNLTEQYFSRRYYDHENSSTMKLRMTDSTLSGVWQSADRIRSFPVVLKETYPEGSFKFTISTIEDSITPYPEIIDGPVAKAKITTVVPDTNIVKENLDFLKAEIEAQMGYDKVSTNTSIEDVAHKSVFDYFFRYKKDLPKGKLDSIDMNSTAFKYEFNQKIGVVFNQDDIVIFSSFTYDYSGGAHPNHSTTFFCVDVKNKKRFALADIMSNDSAKISPLLERVLRKERKISASDKLSSVLFENYILPNDNFYFNKKGIIFFYNPYEIAPYVYGDTELFVPFTELNSFLNPAFIKRLGIK